MRAAWMSVLVACVMAAAAAAAAGCGEDGPEGSEAADAGGGADVEEDSEGPEDSEDPEDPEDSEDSGPGGGDATPEVEVVTVEGCAEGEISALSLGGQPTGLALSEGRAVWADGGDLWMLTLETCELKQVAPLAATQRDPAMSGSLLVWSDDRNGDMDVFGLDLASGEALVVVEAPGDQVGAAVDGSRVAWIDQRKAVGEPAEMAGLHADVWALELGSGEGPAAITDDEAEQRWVDVSGSRLVWTDFGSDPDKRYIPNNEEPNTNNGDILGMDLATGQALKIATDPDKQTRPAIEGELVAWLDWRGISPEPKFQQLKVFVARLGEAEAAQQFLTKTSWASPELFVRPVIVDGHVAWPAAEELRIAAPDAEGGWQVQALIGVQLGNLAAAPGRIAWLDWTPGAVTLSVRRLDELLTGR